jgi:IS5 family transposase
VQENQTNPSQNLALMIRYKSQKQMTLDGFVTPFQTALDKNNRWVKMSNCIPWDELALGYYRGLSSDQGRPAKDARLVIGAVIIKHKLSLSDEETVKQIQENPYLQFFVGLPGFQTKQPFAPSLFVEIRRRMGEEAFKQFEQAIVDRIEKRSKQKTKRTKEKTDPPSGQGTSSSSSESDSGERAEDKREGKLIVDATVAEQAIRYPTDLGLLNESREISERIIDELYRPSGLTKKPRTYRQKARKQYLAIVKQRRPGAKVRRRGIKQQLQYLRRNLAHIEKLLDFLPDAGIPLSYRMLRQYWIIQHIFSQQEEMHRTKTKRCDNRIVSIHQPHVRPIVRGKVNKPVEFGAKLNVSLSGNGLASIDHIGWDAYHEGTDLKSQVENYKTTHGHYPEVVLADPIYGTRANRKYLKSQNIRYAGKPLGRPKKQTVENKEQLRNEKRRRREEYRQRIPIEGKFGQGKNGYRLNYIRAKTAKTSEAWIRSIFLVMNLLVLVKTFIFSRKNWLLTSVISRSKLFEWCILVMKRYMLSTDGAYCNLMR